MVRRYVYEAFAKSNEPAEFMKSENFMSRFTRDIIFNESVKTIFSIVHFLS